MKEFKIEELLLYRDFDLTLKEAMNGDSEAKAILTKDPLTIMALLNQIIKISNSTMKMTLNQLSLVNIANNYGEVKEVNEILNDCKDMLTVGLAIYDLDYEMKDSDLHFKENKGNKGEKNV